MVNKYFATCRSDQLERPEHSRIMTVAHAKHGSKLEMHLAPRERPIAPRMAFALHAHSLRLEHGWACLDTAAATGARAECQQWATPAHFRANWIAAFSW